MATMRAVVVDGYGGPERLEVREIERPEPGIGQLLVRLRATSVNPIDWKLRSGSLRLLVRVRFPLIPGGDVAGEVAAVGEGVGGFREGDRVFALLKANLGGAYAEYAVVGESATAAMPAAASFDEAAAMPLAGMTALQAIRDKGRFELGGRMLVTGASGGVGSFAVQIGKALGAEVTGVASGRRRELVTGLGADAFLDYSRDDFTLPSEEGGTFDLVVDAAAASSFIACRRILSRRGVYITTLPSPGHFTASLGAAGLGLFGYGKRARTILVRPIGTDLRYLAGLYDSGELRPMITETLSLEEIADAHKISEKGHPGGKIVVRI